MSSIESISEAMLKKSCLKQDVFALTKEVFAELKEQLQAIVASLDETVEKTDQRVEIDFKSTGPFDAQITFGGDTLVFHMHTNVFTFPDTHVVRRSPYVKKDPDLAYFGEINIYNFLADSLRYHRMNDAGYLVGRIFINKDRHFFVEGKRQLGFLYNDFSSAVLDVQALRSILQSAIMYALDFDLYAPPYQLVKEITLSDVQRLNQNLKMRTGKRLGFQFSAQDNGIDFTK